MFTIAPAPVCDLHYIRLDHLTATRALAYAARPKKDLRAMLAARRA